MKIIKTIYIDVQVKHGSMCPKTEPGALFTIIFPLMHKKSLKSLNVILNINVVDLVVK